MMVLGGLLAIIGMFGYKGAVSGSRRVLNIYFCLMITVVILEGLVIGYGRCKNVPIFRNLKYHFENLDHVTLIAIQTFYPRLQE